MKTCKHCSASQPIRWGGASVTSPFVAASRRSALPSADNSDFGFSAHNRQSAIGNPQFRHNRSGVALIVCLGLLAVMTLLAVTFSISMRVERQAARNFADSVRAKHMLQAAFVRAIENIDTNMYRLSYPKEDAWSSLGSGPLVTNLLTTEALDLIPGGNIQSAADAAMKKARWITDIPSGRVSFVVVNTSGLLDINSVSTNERLIGLNFGEIDVTGVPEIKAGATRASILAERQKNVRYETIDDLQAIAPDTIGGSVSNFQVFSYDPNPDVLFFKTRGENDQHYATWWRNHAQIVLVETSRPPAALGTRDAELYLGPKFNVNSITNFSAYKDAATNSRAYLESADFMDNYFRPLTNMIMMAFPAIEGERPDDVGWNLVNYLDPDRVPHARKPNPWVYSEGGEAMPLINEIVIKEVTTASGPGYEFHCELWYPFAPVSVKPSDNYNLHLMIFDQSGFNAVYTNGVAAGGVPDEMAVTNYAHPDFSRVFPVNSMEFDTPTEFFVRNTPAYTFSSGGTNVAIGGTNVFYILARVYQTINGVIYPTDESMGYLRGPAGSDPGKRMLFKVDRAWAYGVNDPRSNGQVKYWLSTPRLAALPSGQRRSNGGDYPVIEATLGAQNRKGDPTTLFNPPYCDPYVTAPTSKGGGLPLYATNGPMANIGEIGNIFQSNLDDEKPNPLEWFWRNINLMKADEGAMLLDMMSVRDSIASQGQRGLFCINSRQNEAWEGMFYKMTIGRTNALGLKSKIIRSDSLADLAFRLTKTNCVSFYDLFTREGDPDGGGGDLAVAFRNTALDLDMPGDFYEEDAIREIVELVTFRQNIYSIIMAAQVLAPDGTTPIAERRAIATVYRDSYTGRHFTRSFKWLTD